MHLQLFLYFSTMLQALNPISIPWRQWLRPLPGGGVGVVVDVVAAALGVRPHLPARGQRLVVVVGRVARPRRGRSIRR